MNDDFKFLSHYIAKQFYKILKVDLNNNSFVVLKNDKAEKEKLYDGLNFKEYISTYLNSGYIHKDDKDVIAEKLNTKYILNQLNDENTEINCWFRRKFDNIFKWTLIKIIKVEDFDKSHIVYFFLQDNEVPTKVDINAKILGEYKILKAITKIFVSMYVIDLTTDTYVEYKSNKFVSQYTTSGIASRDLKRSIIHLLLPEFQKKAEKFVDLNTLNERLNSSTFISSEGISKNYGWVRYSFFPVSFDDNGKLTSVVLSITNINKQKVKEQSLIKLSYHDALTGLYNRYSFEKDIHQTFSKKDCVIVSADINNLKEINDTYGHKMGDEIIKRASNCLYKILSTYGKVYRTGGDEFVGIIKVNDNNLLNIISDINSEIKINNSSRKIELSLAIGYAKCNENSSLNIDEIIQIADKNMYVMKENYHSSNLSKIA